MPDNVILKKPWEEMMARRKDEHLKSIAHIIIIGQQMVAEDHLRKEWEEFVTEAGLSSYGCGIVATCYLLMLGREGGKSWKELVDRHIKKASWGIKDEKDIVNLVVYFYHDHGIREYSFVK